MLGGYAGCCCGCDGNTIGFDDFRWPGLVTCFDGRAKPITVYDNIRTLNWDKLEKLCVLFMGNDNQCGRAVHFDMNQWDAIKEWVKKGGRLWINAEYEGCLQDPVVLSNFLEHLGVDLHWLGKNYDCGCGTPDRYMRPGEAALAFYLFFDRMACTAELSGFSTVFYTPNDKDGRKIPMIVIDQLDKGFVVLCGDSNIWQANCSDISIAESNCQLAQRMLDRKSSQMI